MALTVAELAFVFGADTKPVDQGFTHVDARAKASADRMGRNMAGFWRDEGTRANKAADTYGKAGAKAGQSFKDRFSKETRNLVSGIGIGVGAYQLVSFFKNSIDTASDLGETMSKVGVIFGDSRKEISAWAEDTDRNILLTKQQALDAASTFGIFGKAAGKTGEDLADFSLDLTALAQDFSSFFNARPEDAIMAIGSALRGENEPIRQFGVLLDDATLRARALKMGLIATTKDALTPQQKALAAYQEILAQTADAQGDAKRTQDGFANSSRQMAQEVALLKEEIGERLLPAATQFVHFMRDTGVPALSQGVGVVGDLATEFSALPGPVKAAAGAFALLKFSAAMGWTDAASRGVDNLKSAVGSAGQRAQWFSAAYQNARTTVMQFGTATGQASGQAGRMTAAMTALRAASMGGLGALKSGLSSVVGFFGGPWGIALTAATAGVTYFWQEHQKAKQEIEAFTSTLDEETGALTESSRKWAAKRLLDKGVLDDAKALGLSLATVTDAALGQGDALEQLNKQLAMMTHNGITTTGQGAVMSEQARQAEALRKVLNDTNGVVQQSAREADLLADAVGGAGEATADAADDSNTGARAYRNLAGRADDAETAVKGLMKAEQDRHDKAVSRRRDQIALLQTITDTRKEAKDGKKTLDENTKAGQDNMLALLDLADQWNSSAPKVKNAKGAYENLRTTFIDLATEMGGGDKSAKARAQQLAKELLDIPANKQIQFGTPGLKKAIRDVEYLNSLLNLDPGGHGTGARGPLGPDGFAWPGGKSPNAPKTKPDRDPRGPAGATRYADGIDYDRLGASVAGAMGGRIAPVMQVDTLRVHDLDDVRRQARRQEATAAHGGVVFS